MLLQTSHPENRGSRFLHSTGTTYRIIGSHPKRPLSTYAASREHQISHNELHYYECARGKLFYQLLQH